MIFQTFSKSLDFNLDNTTKIKAWLKSVFDEEGVKKDIELSVIFCTDKELLEINKEFLQHDYYTDIITFTLEDSEELLEAELYISIDRVKENGKEKFNTELNRVLVHGILHLCNYNDKLKEEKMVMKGRTTYQNFNVSRETLNV